MEASSIADGVVVRQITPNTKQHFFGYFDRSPWESTDRYMLTMAVGATQHEMPQKDSLVDIGVIDTHNDDRIEYVASTSAWNFQQASMQQWLPRRSSPEFIYNDRREGRLVSIIRAIDGRELKTLPCPVYHISPSGDEALSLNFARLARTRPDYGYVGIKDETAGQLQPPNDGIWKVDVGTGAMQLLISIAELADFRPRRGMVGAEHWCNHLLYNPSGTKFAFVHRWGTPRRGAFAKKVASHRPRSQITTRIRKLLGSAYKWMTGRRFAGMQTRLFVANADGTNLQCLADEGMASHFGWRDDSCLLAWARRVPEGDRYWLFDTGSGEASSIGGSQLTRDGHCSYHRDGRWVLTDTYPDKLRQQGLLLFDTQESVRLDLGTFDAPSRFSGQTRCDLHPRFNHAGTQVCFDSTHLGSRQMYLCDIPEGVYQ